MNVQEVIREIHSRMESDESLSAREHDELNALRSVYGRLFQMRNGLSRMPPGPNTVRAKIGKYLVRVVQRSLFWYTPQIVGFQNESVSALDCAGNLLAWQIERTAALEKTVQKRRTEQIERTAALEDEVQRLRGEQVDRASLLEEDLRKLRCELAELRTQLGRVETTAVAAAQRRPDHVADRLPDAFQFALQDRFRGSERETAGKLDVYLPVIAAEAASLPKAPWLDIACGRGEWLEAAGHAGYEVVGVDSSPGAVARCRAKGLKVEEADALGYLLSAKSESLAVVTAFHAVEHWPMGYVLALVQEAVRVLKPGGLLIVETPNPTNLRMAACNFWNDPTHCRVVPPPLLEFVFEHFGLNIVKRLDLNPAPADERLPFDEISVVHRLNEHLNGPQDYGLIGRR